MKPNKFSVCLSAFAMIVFFASAVVCYFKVNKKINDIDVTPTIAIFNFTQEATKMDISPFDMINSNDEIASSEAILKVQYEGNSNYAYDFNIVMDNYSSYHKTEGVDGINEFEYTYEIFKDNNIIVEETEIDSYEENTRVVLATDSLSGKNNNIEYKIIFRFYTNKYDQSHLLGTKLSSKLSVMPLGS